MSIVASRARMKSGSGRGGRGRGGLLAGAIGIGKRALRGRGGGGMPRRRAKGITGRELRGFRKVVNLLHKVGMQPKKLGRRSHPHRS